MSDPPTCPVCESTDLHEYGGSMEGQNGPVEYSGYTCNECGFMGGDDAPEYHRAVERRIRALESEATKWKRRAMHNLTMRLLERAEALAESKELTMEDAVASILDERIEEDVQTVLRQRPAKPRLQ